MLRAQILHTSNVLHLMLVRLVQVSHTLNILVLLLVAEHTNGQMVLWHDISEARKHHISADFFLQFVLDVEQSVVELFVNFRRGNLRNAHISHAKAPLYVSLLRWEQSSRLISHQHVLFDDLVIEVANSAQMLPVGVNLAVEIELVLPPVDVRSLHLQGTDLR